MKVAGRPENRSAILWVWEPGDNRDLQSSEVGMGSPALTDVLPVIVAIALALIACESDTGLSVGVDGPEDVSIDITPILGHFGSEVEVSIDGDQVVIRSNGVPNHGSPYFDTGSIQYEAYTGSNQGFQLNPNRIAEQQWTFRVPVLAQRAADISATPLGPIGVAVNGVAIFNQYAGPNRPLTFEIDSFDQYNGHPQQTGVYHYHVEPLGITGVVGEEALIGVLLDGFPVYGPFEDGQMLGSSDLDDLHGHYGATNDFPDGVYHYHVTGDDPYINGAGYYGVAGTVTR